MKRFHDIKSIAKRKRREKLWKSTIIGDISLRHKINWNKQHPFSCGNPNCPICHGNKIWNIPTRKMIIEKDKEKASWNYFLNEV